jgi:hypothetical protein
MKPYTRNLMLLLICLLPSLRVVAQELPQEFNLPVVRLGVDYRVEIESVLRDKYRLRVDAGNANAVVLWALASGEMPAGLTIRTDGTIIGNAKDVRVGPYQFSLKAVDMAVRDEPLELRFSLEVKAARLRLTKIEGPRLVPGDTPTPVNTAFNHPASAAAPAIEPKETSAKREEASTNNEPPVKVPEAAVAEPPPAVRQMKKAEDPDFENPFSSLNKRFILGVEQSGAASAKSEGKPFLDLFINTPLVRGSDDDLARVSVWGDVRLTSTRRRSRHLPTFPMLPSTPLPAVM